MLFWSFVSLLQREDFDPFYIRPFEDILSAIGITPGVGPLAPIRQRPGPDPDTQPRNRYPSWDPSVSARHHHNSAAGVIEDITSEILKNVEGCAKILLNIPL